MPGIDDFIDTHFDTGASNDTSNDNSVQDNTPVQDNNVQQPQDKGGNARGENFRDDFAADIKAAQNEVKTNGKQAPKQEQAQGQQSQQGNETAKPQSLRPLRGGVFADDKGNIVDRNGRNLANAGREARLYGEHARSRHELQQAQGRIQTLEREMQTNQALNGLPQRMGLGTEEVTQALTLAAKVRQGQVLDVAREVLAMCVAQGHNVSDLLGSDVGDSIEMKALQRMLDTRLAPITQQEQQRQTETAAEQRAREQYDAFLAQNEYADLHADDIVLVMQSEGLNAQQAYNKLMTFVNRQGLDPSQPIAPQIEALRTQQPQPNGQQQQRQQVQQRQQPTQKPMINGARSNPSVTATSSQMFGAEDDWSSIIRQVQASAQ